MANQQRFQGPDLDALLQRVREEAGPDARIASADKVRSGGIGGFFQRERFEVVVEHTDGAGGADAAAPAPDDVPDAAPTPVAGTGDGARPPRTVAELAERVTGADQVPAGALTELSTEGPTFAEVLAALSEATERDDGDGPDGGPDAPPPGASAPAPGPAAAVGPPTAAHTASVAPAVAAPPATLPPAASTCADEDPTRTAHAPTLASAARDIATAPLARLETARAIQAPLARLGLPAALVPTLDELAGGVRGALVQRLSALPAAPPLPATAGSVAVIAGAGGAALALARRMAADLELPSGHVVVASTRNGLGMPAACRLANPAAAADRRRAWWRRRRLTLVALDAPLDWRLDGFAGDTLDALEPGAVWGVVDAGRKTEDVHTWAERLGGLDAIAIEHLDDTTSPASLLHLGVPVARIDGLAATPARWASVLTSRAAA